MLVAHIGIVVRSLEQGIHQWEEVFGYARRFAIVTNTRHKVRVAFLAKNGSLTVKLVEPTDASSPIAVFARRGGGLHPLCFRCENLKLGVSLREEKGARLTVPPKPGEAFHNKEIAFLSLANINVELIDTTEKEGWLPD